MSENHAHADARSRNGDSSQNEFSALQAIIGALEPLAGEARRRILESAATFLRIEMISNGGGAPEITASKTPLVSQMPTHAPFSQDTSMSPKEFLLEKQPRTDVERVACLAYYLTHYRSTPHFKTADLSMLNTEAAQPKFANTAYSSNNAVKLGYLVPSTKGQRQLSAIGERFVRALPDRNAAKAILDSLRRKSRGKRGRGKSGNGGED